MTKKTREKNKVYWIIFVLFALAIILIAVSLIREEGVLDRKELPVRVEVANVTGLKVDESLDFGRIIHGASGQKKINIVNNYNFPISVEFNAGGDVKDFLVYDQKVSFAPLENKRIVVSTIVFENEPYKEYFGTMSVVFKKA